MLNRTALLNELGIDVWVPRRAVETVAESLPAPDIAPTREELPTSTSPEWEPLAAQVSSCKKCALHTGRTQTVFGEGNRQAKLMIVGEAPGAEEDKQGRPFVGRAGKLLNSMLLALGFQREEVFIANILKCRPPQNRDPATEEVAACKDYLRGQISLVAPEAILAVGRIAAQNLLDVDTPLGKMRGKTYHFLDERATREIPVLVTYHPAYLLRSPNEKRKTWEDLLQVKRSFRPDA
ncbi:MAG: uracil-DNA glycosylase [Pseudomonadota bacterium]